MSTAISLSDLAARNKVVYYPELGYVYFPVPHRADLVTESWIEYAVNYHRRRLKILSLYFDNIYVPYSHLLGVTNSVHALMIQRLLQHPDIRLMCDNYVLFVGGWGGTTKIDLRNHQLAFLQRIGWDTQYSSVIATLPVFDDMLMSTREIGNQMQWLADGVQQYAILIGNSDGKTALPVQEMIKSSQFENIPFVHELFWKQLITCPLPEPLKISAAVEINGIYLSASEATTPGLIACQPVLGGLTAASRLNAVSNTPVLLYSPEVFEAFLQCYFSLRQVQLIGHASAIDLLDLRKGNWNAFIEQYHSLIADLAWLTDHYELTTMTRPELLSQVLKNELVRSTRVDYSAFVTFLMKTLDIVLKLQGVPMALPLPTVDAADLVRKPLVNYITERIIWRRYPVFREWFKILRARLRV